MFAAAINNMAAYQLLLANGATSNLKNVNGQMAKDMLLDNTKSSNQISDSYYNYNQVRQKRSSNMSPAAFILSPHLSPITPLAIPHQHQIFFPPDFSGRLLSPTMSLYRSPDMHFQIATTPLPGQYTPVPVFSPCLNECIPPHSISCGGMGYFREYSPVNMSGNGAM